MKPRGAGSQFHNYKGFESIILQAAADSNYQFLFAECGGGGRSHDAATFAATEFYTHLQEGLNIPPPEQVGDYPHRMPYCFVGDEAYAMRPDFIQPFPQRAISDRQDIYNRLHCKARRYIECAFGIMTMQFGVFRSAIPNFKLEMIETMIVALCILHNILRRNYRVYRDNVLPEDVPFELNEEDLADQQPTESGRESREKHTDYANYLRTFLLYNQS